VQAASTLHAAPKQLAALCDAVRVFAEEVEIALAGIEEAIANCALSMFDEAVIESDDDDDDDEKLAVLKLIVRFREKQGDNALDVVEDARWRLSRARRALMRAFESGA
jgi:hypothetical protein